MSVSNDDFSTLHRVTRASLPKEMTLNLRMSEGEAEFLNDLQRALHHHARQGLPNWQAAHAVLVLSAIVVAPRTDGSRLRAIWEGLWLMRHFWSALWQSARAYRVYTASAPEQQARHDAMGKAMRQRDFAPTHKTDEGAHRKSLH